MFEVGAFYWVRTKTDPNKWTLAQYCIIPHTWAVSGNPVSNIDLASRTQPSEKSDA